MNVAVQKTPQRTWVQTPDNHLEHALTFSGFMLLLHELKVLLHLHLLYIIHCQLSNCLMQINKQIQ